jgi:hypothetical protein
MVTPSSLTVKLVLDNGRELAITMNIDYWSQLEKKAPEHYPLFFDWATEFDKAGWPDADSAVS